MIWVWLGLLIASPVRADVTVAKPLIEAGVSGGMGFVPDYPASRQGRMRYLVFPVFHLRGKVLRSDDEDGSRARLLKHSLFAFELSASGSFPTSSDENRARAGMDDLEWLGELGPRVFVNVRKNSQALLRLSLSTRAALSTDLTRGRYRGLTFTPGIAYDRKRWLTDDLTWTLRVAPQFTTRELQAYFYSVPDGDALLGRPAFSARAGYIGTWLTSGWWFERGNFGVFGGGSVSFHDGAANTDSPLFKDRMNWAGFLGFRYYFYKSSRPGHL